MPSVTETRLNAYLAAEAAILRAQEARGGDRTVRMADLAEVRAQIDKLQAQFAREQAGHGGGLGGLRTSLADLSGRG